MLKFKPEGMKKLHFFDTCQGILLVIATYTDQELELMTAMEDAYQTEKFTFDEIVEWAEEQKLAYQILTLDEMMKIAEK